MQVTGWWWGLALTLGVWGCGPSKPVQFPAESIEVPEPANVYSTQARPEGATGGPGLAELEAKLRAALVKRGHQPTSDGALGAAASWGLREVHQRRQFDALGAEAAAAHFGFGGVVVAFWVMAISDESSWRQTLDSVPPNLVLNRYGIRVSPSGQSAAVVLGRTEVSYEPLKRLLEPGESVTLKGQVEGEQRGCQLFLTKPDGSVHESPCSSRSFEQTFGLPEPGLYRLEVAGRGRHGPNIVANLRLFVGIPEPSIAGPLGSLVEPAEAERRMLELLNRDRVAAGLAPLRPDAELREIALGHTEDLIDHNFNAHVSPSTGTPDDRLARSGVLVSLFGENVALAATPEQAHEGLMGSPGHRANMLRPGFTHVGIAAGKGNLGLVVTMNFGRRPNPADVPGGVPQLERAMLDLRQAKGLGPVSIDPVYRAGAQAAADSLAEGGSQADQDKAMREAIQREVDRLGTSRPTNCVYSFQLLEVAQLTQVPALFSPDLKRIGIGAHPRTTAKGKSLSTVLIADGAACQAR